jgi:hypothetical protein
VAIAKLRSKDDFPKIVDVVKEVHENIEKLREFDPEEKSKCLWVKVKRGINKFMRCTHQGLTNFMIATKDVQ